MAMELQDLMALKSMGEKDSMSPYEQVKLDYMAAKKPSGVAITGIVFGGAALVGVAAGMVLNGMYANAKAGQAKEAALASEKVASAQYQATLQLIAQGNANTKDNIDRLLPCGDRSPPGSAGAESRCSTAIQPLSGPPGSAGPHPGSPDTEGC